MAFIKWKGLKIKRKNYQAASSSSAWWIFISWSKYSFCSHNISGPYTWGGNLQSLAVAVSKLWEQSSCVCKEHLSGAETPGVGQDGLSSSSTKLRSKGQVMSLEWMLDS